MLEKFPEYQFYFDLTRVIILMLSSIAIPLIVFFLGKGYTKTREAEEKLRSERISIYYGIIEPHLLVFTTDEVMKNYKPYKKGMTGVDLATEKLLSLDYQDLGFKLSLIGSDEVLRAFNTLMQMYYDSESDMEKKGEKLIQQLAILLFEIRKSLGIEKTDIHPLEMLEWKIKDIREYQDDDGKYPTLT